SVKVRRCTRCPPRDAYRNCTAHADLVEEKNGALWFLAHDYLGVARIATAMVKGRYGDTLLRLQRRDQIRQAFHTLDGLAIEGQEDILDLKTGLPQRAVRVHAGDGDSLL